MKSSEEGHQAREDQRGKLHSLNNCISVARSGCILINDALNRSDPDEALRIVQEMQRALKDATELTRSVSRMMTDGAS